MTPELAKRRAQLLHQPLEWQEPVFFPGNPDGLQEAFDTGKVLRLYDEAEVIANSLFKMLHPHPDQRNDTKLRRDFVEPKIDLDATFGQYVLDPFTGELARIADKDHYFMLLGAADNGLVAEGERQVRQETTVMAAGLSVGSEVAVRYAMEGYGTIILAEFDDLEPMNMNRIRASSLEVGAPKLLNVARWIARYNPYIKQIHLPEGLNAASIEIVKRHKPRVVADEMDSWEAKAILDEGLIEMAAEVDFDPALVSAADTGRVSQLDIRYPGRKGYKPFNGRMNAADIAAAYTPEGKAFDYVLKVIGRHNMDKTLRNALAQAGSGELACVPQLGMTATLGGVLAAHATNEIVAGREIKPGSYACSIPKTFRRRQRDWLFRKR
ncbi:MAG TPA: ThiF family adenylyltransferase [Candidatus Saccharimonadales bacterium]|nr:ThiF family adenylyltransferase [Candidatus Saccharimonadales bacterium]